MPRKLIRRQKLCADIPAQRSVQALTHLRQLKACLRQQTSCYWAIGDHLIALVGVRDTFGNRRGGLGYTLKELAEMFSYKPARLCQIYKTAIAFPREKRTEATFFDHELARRARRLFPEIVTDLGKSVHELSRAKVADPRTGTTHAIRTMRDVARYYAKKRESHEALETLRGSAKFDNQSPVDSCYHGRFQDLVPGLIRQDIRFQMIFADPPYVYPNYQVYAGQSAGRTACDSQSVADAMATTVDLLRLTQPLLQPHGCLLLCQPAGPLLMEYMRAICGHNWEIYRELIWDKCWPKPGDLEGPYAASTERIWVLKRPGEKLRNHDLSDRSDILVEKAVEHSAATPLNTHMYQKPGSLCRRLVSKHTQAGGLVFEPFGCSGEMCLAAIELGRRFIYCESNADNFQWGDARIAHFLCKNQQKRCG